MYIPPCHVEVPHYNFSWRMIRRKTLLIKRSRDGNPSTRSIRQIKVREHVTKEHNNKHIINTLIK
jgi:hypothetical protein